MIVRLATEADAPGVQAIYAQHVVEGDGTFEELVPDIEMMARRIAAVLERGQPYFVAEDGGRIAAFAYASSFRTRAAYRYTLEDSVYVAQDAKRRGYGRAVLVPVIEGCRALGVHQLVAVIGGSDNAGSIGLHRSLGFQDAGVLRGLGYKFGRWLDVVNMQLPLNGGLDAPPSGDGVQLG